jgi:hypothetical protein
MAKPRITEAQTKQAKDLYAEHGSWRAAGKASGIHFSTLRGWANPGSGRAASARYYQAHPERARQNARRWKAANSERVREYSRQYAAAHPLQANQRRTLRYAELALENARREREDA